MLCEKLFQSIKTMFYSAGENSILVNVYQIEREIYHVIILLY